MYTDISAGTSVLIWDSAVAWGGLFIFLVWSEDTSPRDEAHALLCSSHILGHLSSSVQNDQTQKWLLWVGRCTHVLQHCAEATRRHGQKCNAIALPVIFGGLSTELLRVGEIAWSNAEPLASGVFSSGSIQKLSFQLHIGPRGHKLGWTWLEPEIWLIKLFFEHKNGNEVRNYVWFNPVKSSLFLSVLQIHDMLLWSKTVHAFGTLLYLSHVYFNVLSIPI